MLSRPVESRDPYRIVVFLGSERGSKKGYLQIEESKYLELLTKTYKVLYQDIGEKLGVGRLQFAVRETSSREKFKRQLTNIRRRSKDTDGIHFMGHGGKENDNTCIEVGCEAIDLKSESDRNFFEGLGDGWILFSCCQIGEDTDSLDRLAKISGRTIFAYGFSNNRSHAKDVGSNLLENQAFIVDSLFYHLALVPSEYFDRNRNNVTYARIHDRLNKAVEALAIGAKIHMFSP